MNIPLTASTPLTPRQLHRLRTPRHRHATVAIAATAALVAAAAALVLIGLERVGGSVPASGWVPATWRGNYADCASFAAWILGDTTEPGYAHSALGGVLMILGGYLAHRGFRGAGRWMGYPVCAGTGLFPWAVASAGLGLVLSNLAWGWTIASTGHWQPTFVPFASVPPAVVLIYGGRLSVVVTGAVLGAAVTTPTALTAVDLVCRPLGLPDVVGATAGMWVSALAAFLICRKLPWMPPARVSVPRCHAGLPHCFTDAGRQGPAWAVRRMLADFTEAQFIGNEWASAGLLLGTLASYLIEPSAASGAGQLLPRVMIGQILSAAVAVTIWQHHWSEYGWYPTFIPIVSVTPAVVLAFHGTTQSIVVGAVLGALVCPPVAAAIARRLPGDFHPFIGNVMSMTITTTVIIGALWMLPGLR